MKGLKYAAAIALSLAFLALAAGIVGVGRIVELMSRVDVPLLLLACAAHLCSVTLAAVRWKLLLPDSSLAECFKGFSLGMFLSDVTPSRSGIFGAAEYLKRRNGTPRARAVHALMLSQLFDFSFRTVILAGFLLLFFGALNAETLAMLVLFLALLNAATVVFLKPRAMVKILKLPWPRFVKDPMSRYVEGAADVRVMPRTIVAAYALTFVGWLAVSARWYLVWLALYGSANFVLLAFSLSIAYLAAFLPALGGIGSVELGALALLTRLGLQKDDIVTFVILDRFVYVGTDLAASLPGALDMFRAHKRKARRKRLSA